MILLRTTNVNAALPEAARQVLLYGKDQKTRNGLAKVIRGTFATVYERPWERVLESPERDANPFFHLMEALWMLAGRNDVAFPTNFNLGFADYSDDGISFHGAYGFRWRNWFGHDQIRHIVEELTENPESRRSVLQMYDARFDHSAARRGGKDIPCNLMATFQVNPGEDQDGEDASLDMVVFNRSNDLIWGAYGSNVVHFSMLQELIARELGLSVGEYTQVSANTHVYEKHWPLLQTLANREQFADPGVEDPYARRWNHRELLSPDETLAQFLEDCAFLCLEPLYEEQRLISPGYFRTRFFHHVVVPMWNAVVTRRREDTPRALQNLMESGSATNDWLNAGRAWLARRIK